MPTQRLPPIFLVRRVMDSNDYRHHYYALITTTYMRPPISLQEHPTFTLIEHPESILTGGHWQITPNEFPTGRWFPAQIYRPSRRPNATLFHNTEFAYCNITWKQADGATIPFISLKRAAGVLPSNFYGIGALNSSARYGVCLDDSGNLAEIPLFNPENDDAIPQLIPEEHEDEIVPQLIPEPSAPPSIPKPSSAFPQHLVNMIVEAAIEKGSSCPVSFDPLTKTSARLTPCGHLVSHPAVECWLSSAHSCPVCRMNLAMETLMEWRG